MTRLQAGETATTTAAAIQSAVERTPTSLAQKHGQRLVSRADEQ
jgi:hypothetical protein